MSDSKIEWTDATWNPVRGCARVSPGCENCYAERQAHRFSAAGQPYAGLTVLGKHGPRWAGRARFVPEMLDAPLRWKKPRKVFVNSMSDLFHEDVSNEQIAAVFGVMAACPHTFQILTKRPVRMLEVVAELYANDGAILTDAAEELAGRMGWCHAGEDAWAFPLRNVWLGVSCEDQQRADERIPLLLQCPAAVRFVSAEPLLGPIDLTRFLPEMPPYPEDSFEVEARKCEMPRASLSWVIGGGESGPGARPCDVEWIRSIVRQCRDAGVACFVKQLGRSVRIDGAEFGIHIGPDEHWQPHDRKGGDPSEWPHDLRVREFPAVQP